MREIVTLCLGQCGNRIGSKFWEDISREHLIDSSGNNNQNNDIQNENKGVFFNETSSGSFYPRTVLADLETSTIDSILSRNEYGKLYPSENIVFGTTGAGSNWGKGYFTEGSELIDILLDIVRKEAESSDSLQSFNLLHSLGGGTGSGYGSLVIEKLRDMYPEPQMVTYSLFPY